MITMRASSDTARAISISCTWDTDRSPACGVWVELDADLVEQPACVASHPGVVHEPEAAPREAAQPDVLHHGACRDRMELLLDHRDAGAHRLRRCREAHRVAPRARSRPRRAGRDRPGRSSASTCRRRSRRTGRGRSRRATVRSTDSSAVTPGKALVMPRMTSNGAPAAEELGGRSWSGRGRDWARHLGGMAPSPGASRGRPGVGTGERLERS